MRSRLFKTGLVCAAAAALGSCNWGTFDDLKGDTWAVLLDLDDSGVSGDFGIEVAAVPAAGNGVTFVISSGVPAGLAQATLDGTGERTSFVGFDADQSGGGQLRPVAASTPVLALVASEGTKFLAGVPGKSNVVEFETGLNNPRALLTSGPADAGSAIAIGNLGIGTAALDVVAVGGTTITVIPDGTGNPASCQLIAPAKNNNVPVVPLENVKLARLDTGGGADQIIVGARDSGGTPRIYILDASQVQAAGGDLCPTTNSISLTGSVAPGSIQIGDVDGNGDPDIVAGTLGSASPGQVTVFLNPKRGQAAPAPMVIPDNTTEGSSTLRGTRIRVANIDDDAAQEIIVGDALASVNGEAGVGQVQIYRWGTGGSCPAARGPACLVRTLYDPGAKKYFGRSLAIASFKPASGAASNILAVGQKDQVVVYFQISTTGDKDPRK